MTTSTEVARAWFAEDLRVTHHLTSVALVRALATVPRERFLGPGPWLIRGLAEGGPHATDDADPVHVYHNVSVAIDPARDLYNGQPGLIARWIEDLGVAAGARVWHVGCGTGYFTAILGEVVGPDGRVIADEIDGDLAACAVRNLEDRPWVEVRTGEDLSRAPTGVDIVLVNAGATHVLDVWLDALVDGGRLLVPLTVGMPAMGTTIGKGVTLLARRSGPDWPARTSSMVAIHSLVGLRDDAMASTLGRAMMSGSLGRTTRLRRDPHDLAPTCLLHGKNCLS